MKREKRLEFVTSESRLDLQAKINEYLKHSMCWSVISINYSDIANFWTAWLEFDPT